MKGWSHTHTLSLLLLLLAWIPLAPLLTGTWFPFQHDLFLSDLLHVHLPYRAELHERLAAGELPQWWPDVFSGMPYVAQIETGVFWPPNLIAFYCLEAPQGLNAVWLVQTLIAGVCGWFYARSLGARPLVASFAGVAWSLSGGMISHIKHPNFQAAIALMPLLFGTLELALQPKGRFVWFALAVTASALAGMPQVTWLTLLGCGVRALVAWIYDLEGDRADRIKALRQAGGLGLASALGVLGAAVTLLPTVYTKAISARRNGLTWEEAYRLGNRPYELLSVLVPVGQAPYTQLYLSWESWFYLGLSVSACSILGVYWSNRQQRLTWVMLILVPFVLSLKGPANWLLWNVLPGMNAFRFHQRFMLVAAIAVLSFAIIGANGLVDRLPPGRWRTLVPLLLVALTILDLSMTQRGHLRWERWEHWTQPSPLYEVIPANGAEGRFLHIDEFHRMFDMSAKGPSEEPGTYRSLSSVPLGSLGAFRNRWSAGGYTNLLHYRVSGYFNQRRIDRRYQPLQWLDGQPTPAWRSMMDRASVGFVLTEKEVASDSPMPVLLHGDTQILRNDTRLPRAYVAQAWHAVGSNDEAADYMLGPGVSQPSVPTIEGTPSDGVGDPVAVAVPVTSQAPEHVEVDLSHAPEGWLVLTDSNYPGWSATLDGEPVPIRFANGYQRAVWVESGNQRLVFQYWTPGLTLGAWLSGTALLGMLFWASLPLIRLR